MITAVPPDAIIGDFAYFPNQKGIGGKRHLIKGNLTECKTACVNNDDCTALDWRWDFVVKHVLLVC